MHGDPQGRSGASEHSSTKGVPGLLRSRHSFTKNPATQFHGGATVVVTTGP